ncbi:MAG: hypothetical protein ACRDMH_00180 [Solirubrobacterales bacterium]
MSGERTPVEGRPLENLPTDPDYPAIPERALGWLKYLHWKANLADDWSKGGQPNEVWDNYSTPPTLSWHRFDLIDSCYALAALAEITPAWRELYVTIFDQLLQRYSAYWAAIDWLEQIGHDPDRAKYPISWRGVLVPEAHWGRYDAPGWTANGVEPWGLQLDPIGANGNLFYKGWFDLMLGLRRSIGGDDRWNEAFEVVGDGENTFTYTHRQVNEVLEGQWGNRPEGVHCENTKIWPFCLSAAALGLQLHDLHYQSESHWVFDQWWQVMEQRYTVRNREGRPSKVALYYDPLVDELLWAAPTANLGLAFYLAPQRREMAEQLFRGIADQAGWSDADRPVQNDPDPHFIPLGIALAREFGDGELAERLQSFADDELEPTWDEAQRFSYGFGLGERFPRGQPNGIMALAQLLPGEQGWSNLFRVADRSRFEQPTVCNVNFPDLGISQAYFDPHRQTLAVSTYGPTTEATKRTSFTIAGVPKAESWRVVRDGRAYSEVRVIERDRLEIGTDTASHNFLIETGKEDR